MALTLFGTVSDNTTALDRKTATPIIINGDMQIAQRSTSVTGKTLISATSSAAALIWLIWFSNGFGPATPNCKQMKLRLLRSGGMVAAS